MIRNLFIVLLIVFAVFAAVAFTQVAFAQDSDTEQPALAEPGDVIDMTPPGLEAPTADFAGLEDFLKSTEVIMGLLTFLFVLVGRIIFPNTIIDTEHLLMVVTFAFGVIYLGAGVFGYGEWLQKGVGAGTMIANTVWALLAMMGVSSAAYLALGKVLDNPLVVRSQGSEWWSLEKPSTFKG